jgi:DNA-binding SARP family transcriptional activator/tetratricopeptide (TPR) repeat protein
MAKLSAGEIRLLCIGDARVETEVGVIEPTAHVVFATAIYLLFERARPISRVALAEMLWPEVSPPLRLHRLRQTLLKLRRSGVYVEPVGKSQIRLAHERAIIEHECTNIEELPVAHIEAHRFRPLSGFEPKLSSEYTEWLERKRSQIAAILARGILNRIAKHRLAGEWSDVEICASSLLQLTPLNEEATLALAEAFAMRGAKHSATQLLDEYLKETGTGPTDLRVQATLMRRRIADRITPRSTNVASEAPLVGRSDVMTHLGDLLKSTKSGVPESFLILGDAGIGKSRVLAEFAQFASLQGFITARINCRPSHRHRPLSAFVELAPILKSLPGAIGCSPETLQFLNRLIRHEPNRDNERPETADAAWIFGGVQRALFDLVDAVAHESPLLIQLEDIHWMDGPSAEILREMIERLPPRVLFGLTGREASEEWSVTSPSSMRVIRLEPIGIGDSGDLVSNILRQHAKKMDSPYLEWCVRVAEGNPYFLTELTNHWIETGSQHEVPPSLSAVLRNRISRLDGDALQLLQTCALLENNSTLSRIEAVLEQDAFQLLRSINDLATAGMIVIDSIDTASAYTESLATKHELLSSAALMQLSAPARRFLHRRIGQVLEGEIDEHFSAATLWDSAKHWQLAGDNRRAWQLGTSCASYLMKVGLPVAAANAYSKSLAFCSTDKERLDILLSQTVAFYRMSAWPSVIETAATVRVLQHHVTPEASEHDDVELMVLRAQWQTFEWDHVLKRALVCLSASNASASHRAEAGVMALMLVGFRGDIDTAYSIHQLIERLIASGGIAETTKLETQMVFHTNLGDLDLGLRAARQLVEEQRMREDVGELFRANCNSATVCRIAGLFDESERLFRAALEIAESHGLVDAVQRVIPHLANMSLEIGKMEQARSLYKRLADMSVSAGNRFSFVERQSIGARLALYEGRGEDAKRMLPVSLEETVTDPFFQRRTYNLSLHAAVQLTTGGRASVDVTERLEASFLRTRHHVHQAYPAFVLYVALRQNGELERAERHLQEYCGKFRREPWPAPVHLLHALEAAIPSTSPSLSGPSVRIATQPGNVKRRNLTAGETTQNLIANED